MTMLPYESLSAFNRRVEIALRPSIDTAIRHSKASSAKQKNAAKAAKAAKAEQHKDSALPAEGEAITSGNQKTTKVATAAESVDPHAKKERVRTGPTEFAEASQRRSVADVVQAPPTLKKAMRRVAPATRAEQALPVHRQPVSESIRAMMEVEREKAIKVYREMKVSTAAQHHKSGVLLTGTCLAVAGEARCRAAGSQRQGVERCWRSEGAGTMWCRLWLAIDQCCIIRRAVNWLESPAATAATPSTWQAREPPWVWRQRREAVCREAATD